MGHDLIRAYLPLLERKIWQEQRKAERIALELLRWYYLRVLALGRELTQAQLAQLESNIIRDADPAVGSA